jgi:dimeric dUTPase (all-alpha-NTP-PPase superfamily)
LTDAFLHLFHAIQLFKQEKSSQSYQNMWKSFLGLGHTLELTEEDIIDAYYNKNKVNFQRQDQGY